MMYPMQAMDTYEIQQYQKNVDEKKQYLIWQMHREKNTECGQSSDSNRFQEGNVSS